MAPAQQSQAGGGGGGGNPSLLSFLSLLLGPLVLLWGLVKRWRTPSPPSIARMPSLVELYGRVAAGALKPKLPRSLEGHPRVAVSVEEPLVVDPARLATYLKLVKLSPPQVAGGESGGVSGGGGDGIDAPAGFLFAESFRVGMLAMAQPEFPFNVLGAVLSRNRLRLERGVRAGDRLLLSAEIDPSSYQRNEKGDVEAVVRTLARDAATNAPVWSSELTVLVLDPKRRRGPPGGGAQAKGKKAQQEQEKQAEPFLVLAPQLRIGGDAGRRYGALSGDRNPIHMSALSAKLFGFSRPIAHAMYLVGCMEAALRGYEGAADGGKDGGGNRGSGRRPFAGARYPLLLESEFRRPTPIPATLRAVLPVAPLGGDDVMQVAIVEPRGSVVKDVVVGTLRQGAKAVGGKK
jgi:acyl dehydratase